MGGIGNQEYDKIDESAVLLFWFILRIDASIGAAVGLPFVFGPKIRLDKCLFVL